MMELQHNHIEWQSSPTIDIARRIGLAVASAEKALGIDPPPRMSFEDRLDQCLQGAMANPKAVSIEIYRVLYAMRRREPEPGSLSQT